MQFFFYRAFLSSLYKLRSFPFPRETGDIHFTNQNIEIYTKAKSRY